MNNFFLLLLFIINTVIIYAQNTFIYNGIDFKSEYHIEQGKLNGKYISYYKNGYKKSEGKFENNNRIGLWTVWDSIGNIRVKRNYHNNFIYKQILPKAPKDKPILLLNIPQYELKYNNDNYIEYFNIKERMIVFSKSYYRRILIKNNPIIFYNNKLFNILIDNVKNNNITVYKDSMLSQKIKVEDLNLKNIEVLGFTIKEVFFFDNERFVSEKRIISLSPIIRDNSDTILLFWVSFNQIRKYLALENIEKYKTPKYIKTLDDLFFFRYFASNIITKTEEKNNMEIDLVEIEHDIWLNNTISKHHITTNKPNAR